MASIEDMIANPMVADVGGAYYGGVDARLARDANKLEILSRRLQYHEALKDVENKALERQMSKRKLQFGLAHQDEMMNMGLAKDKVDLGSPVLDDAARDIPFVNDEASYGAFLTKHKDILPQMQELLGPDGKPKPFKDALPALNDIRKARIYSIGHQQDINLAEIRASAVQPSMPAPRIDSKQLDAARTSNDKFLKDKGFDLGGDSESSDRRRLEYTVAYITQQVNQARSDRGLKTNEDDVRSKIQTIAEKHIKDNRFNIPLLGKMDNPFKQDATIDWDSVNKEINSTFGIDISESGTGISVSGPSVLMTDNEIPRISTEEEYNKLEPGQEYIDPTGKQRTKKAK
jgi:hypothetical protein